MSARTLSPLASPLAAILIAVAVACASGGPSAPPASEPYASPTPDASVWREKAETQHLPRMRPELAELVSSQPWFETMTEAQLGLVMTIQECEQASKLRGQTDSVISLLKYAAAQPWYQDGLDDDEATGLRGIFLAYGRSLKDNRAPPIGPVIATSLKFRLFEVLHLPESGTVAVIVSAEDMRKGQLALSLAVEALPRVEALVGPLQYAFLHLEVTPDLPPEVAGYSYNEFIAVGTGDVNADVVIHEIAHSTVYGLFPLWFEEGLAHFVQHYLTDSLETGVREFTRDLQILRRDSLLDVRYKAWVTLADEYAARAQGFLFLKALADVQGVEGLSQTVRGLRTRTFTSQELLNTIAEQAPAEQQADVRRLFCDRVVGSTRNFC
jgi:hypothetical protein